MTKLMFELDTTTGLISAVSKPVRTATLVVAASNSSAKGKAQADYVCDSVDDHIEIQAAIDALPATGGEVKLLDGTYHVEVQIDLDTNQTLRGCGRNTILTTTTADLIFLSAVGGSGTEKTGIVITDLQIDGGVGAVSNCGIYFEYVDYSFIQNVYSRRHVSGTGSWLSGIVLFTSDFNQIVNNTCQGNVYGIYLEGSNNNTISGNTCQGNIGTGIDLSSSSNNNTISGNTCQGNDGCGITLDSSSNNTISGNTCQGNNASGITLDSSSNNTVTGNTCQGNHYGIDLSSSSNNNTISGNTCQRNSCYGIDLYVSNNNTIIGNTCVANSQAAANIYDDIFVTDNSNYNNVQGNTCRSPTIGTTLTVGELAGATDIRVTDETGFEVGLGVVIDLGGGNEEYHRISAITAGIITIDAPLVNNQGAGETIDVPSVRYGINIATADCDGNLVTNNDLYDDGFGTGSFNDAGTLTVVRDDNRGIEITQVRHYDYVKNTSGGDLAAGDVVVLKAVAAGNEITTTTTEGDQKVFGMVAEAIADNASGYVLVKGKTTVLKVDGTADIAIGDLIGCFTTAKIGMKAASGKMAFAIALEAYATDDSNGVIDALLIVPRQAV